MTDDQYTELVLEASVYEELRLRRGVLTRLSIAAKIGCCSVLFFIAATIGPIAAVLPTGVRAQYFDAAPTAATLSLTLLALFGCLCLLFACAGLTWIGRTREPIESLSEEKAWQLVGLENIFTGVAFLTGGLGIISALLLMSTGLFGAGTVEQVATMGVEPYQTSAGLARTPVETSVIAVLGGVLTAADGLLVHRNVDTNENVAPEASQ